MDHLQARRQTNTSWRVEAATEAEAIEKAAAELNQYAAKLMAVRRTRELIPVLFTGEKRALPSVTRAGSPRDPKRRSYFASGLLDAIIGHTTLGLVYGSIRRACHRSRRLRQAGSGFRVGVQDQRLEEAFAGVERERYLGPGPWPILRSAGYVSTPNADPVYLYCDSWSVSCQSAHSIIGCRPIMLP
jgi:hypothetical protein